ncbi:TlpA family protein disulfide reductase [Pollutimonas bauzanensis]|uniref:Iron complex outermembrane recepter protein n=1 Tax=Pollutimonas bauzanensis TaxID=658167 RepID=A0A1M5MRI6_9BURK|nr:hypothetical protein [Pollutimonas bauzanensis]SHG79837.1 iron complex outermembrane recepter protein [Pollutimonas bauzanensis]
MMKLFLLLISLLMAFPAAAAPLEPLAAGDVPALLKPPAHGVRVIALWALYCAYCEANLRELAALSASDPDVQAVTVSTDDIEQRDAIIKRLSSARAESIPARAYADESPQRLNYLIDPRWGGETPRTLVIRADGSRAAISGTLTAARLKALVNKETD